MAHVEYSYSEVQSCFYVDERIYWRSAYGWWRWVIPEWSRDIKDPKAFCDAVMDDYGTLVPVPWRPWGIP